MFFIKAGSIVAWVAVIFGAFSMAGGLWITLSVYSEGVAQASDRYFARAIGDGATIFAYGVIIGLLAEIAKKLRDTTETS